jgi:large subunit ribosomal protein L2
MALQRNNTLLKSNLIKRSYRFFKIFIFTISFTFFFLLLPINPMLLAQLVRRLYGCRIGTGRQGIVDTCLSLGKPFEVPLEIPAYARPLTAAEQMHALIDRAFVDPEEAMLCRSLISAGKIKKSLHAHEFIRAVKCMKRGEPIPTCLQPVDIFTVPENGQPVPHLTYLYKRNGGRSSTTGRITVRHRGGGDARLLYIVDTKRADNVPQRILRVESQVRRSAKLALVQNMEGPPHLRYVLAHAGASPGDVLPNDGMTPVPGNTLPMRAMPPGTFMYNIELRPGDGGKLVRAAGTRARLTGFDTTGTQALVELPSKRIRAFPIDCRATVGQASHPEWRYIVLGKAGARRRLGWRPSVRGVAMNPIDHPHGGGKGGKSKGNLSQSPWGKLCK